MNKKEKWAAFKASCRVYLSEKTTMSLYHTRAEGDDMFYRFLQDDIDFVEEYGCSAEDVCIFTNPPFKGLSSALKQIRSDYLLFGSNAVDIVQGVFAKDAGGFFYIKNNTDYKGNADEFAVKYGSVRTFFYSNRMFLTHGKQYINETDRSSNVFFGRQNLKRVN